MAGRLAALRRSPPPTAPHTMANNKNMDALLKWSIAQQGADDAAAAASGQPSMAAVASDIAAGRRPDLADPGLFDAIMGKSEATMMREELGAALDEKRTEEDRVTALDNFEMLIESIDNANNISSMSLWPSILSLLSSTSERIRAQTLWVLGTAVQNNDKAQIALLAEAPMPRLLQLLVDADDEVRGKAVYALSALLKHNPAAVVQFDTQNGWEALKSSLEDPVLTIRRKAAFLINTLLMQEAQTPVIDAASAASSPALPSAPLAAPNGASKASTALTLVPGQSASTPPATPAASAPLERGPATLAAGVSYPPIAPALLQSGALTQLISSLLPSASEGAVALAPLKDGSEARADLDYSEKAARAIASWADAVAARSAGRGASGAVNAATAALLGRLTDELEGPPLDAEHEADVTARWQEVGLDAGEWEQLRERSANFAAEA